MGSLVPGWDADLGVPRDLADTEADKEPEGYFARLRSHRHSTEGPSLERISAPQSLGRSISKPAPVQRASTLSHGAGAPLAGGSHKYQFTDWSEELSSLRKSGLGRSSVGSHEGRHEQQQGPAGAAWWRSLEVGHLNDHPDAIPSSAPETQRATFVPQFIPSQHKLDFGDEATK